jgi:hypothetical protein
VQCAALAASEAEEDVYENEDNKEEVNIPPVPQNNLPPEYENIAGQPQYLSEPVKKAQKILIVSAVCSTIQGLTVVQQKGWQCFHFICRVAEGKQWPDLNEVHVQDGIREHFYTPNFELGVGARVNQQIRHASSRTDYIT